ncbi:MAG: chordopoxvirus fusion protein [Thermodesulfovibrio sp.]
MIFGIELIEELEKLDPAVRTAFLKILRLIEQTIGDVVKKEDFLALKRAVEELSENVKELSKNVKELAEAQKHAEERLTRLEQTVAELAEAQKHAEERLTRLEQTVAELAEAQKEMQKEVSRLDKAIQELSEAQKRTEQRVEELAEAQKRTEESLRKLTEEHKKTREHLGGLSNTVGYILENEAYKHLPKLLMEDFGIDVEGRLIRDFIELPDGRYEEVNIFGKGRKNGKELIIVGEAKTQLKKADIDAFLKKLSKIEKVHPQEKILLMVTHQVVNPQVFKYAQQKGIAKVYLSYQFA